MSIRITPEPDETERKAILEALAAEGAQLPATSGWPRALLPSRETEEREP